MFLFTFLIDPPCENAEQDLIRSQIYAFFNEDAFLLLPFVEMKDDFSNKKMLLSSCMMGIDLANAKIRQLDCRFSDTWIRSEADKLESIYFVSLQRELHSIERCAQWADQVLFQLHFYGMDLRFLRMFLLCFATWDNTDDDETRIRLSSMITSLQEIWGTKEENGLLDSRLHEICTGDITDWHPLASELEEKIQLSKLEFEAWWVSLFHWPFRCKPSTSYKILKLLEFILDNLNDLKSNKAGKIILYKKQIESLEEKLVFLKIFLRLCASCKDKKDLTEFKKFVQVFVNDAACLTFLFWAKDANDKIASETNSMLSHMMQKIKPATLDVARLYFRTLTAIYVQRSDSFMFGQAAMKFVDFFLEDAVTLWKDGFRILRDDIIFLLTFLNDPPNENAEEIICNQIDVLFWEGVYGLLPFDGMEGDFSKKKVLLSDFMMKIESVNANIKQMYVEFPDSSLYNFPKIISSQFLDFLIQNLRNLKQRMTSDQNYAPFAKYKILKIEKELVSLGPSFNHVFDLRCELNQTWLEAVNSLQMTEHVISSCISSWFVFDHPIWYHMAYLSNAFDGIMIVKTKLEKIMENNIYNARCLPGSVGFTGTLIQPSKPSEINDIVMGFEDEAEKIIGYLIRGMSLDIVSIVGMGGLGKTTLVKKIYGSSLVKCNFVVFAFCYVSHNHDTRRILLDILGDVMGPDSRFHDMTDDDMAHQLWKCLSRQKYLIVLDDIWNESAWNKVKSSFPDDKNGSRVIFTTRYRDVANKCKITCNPHQLRFMSEVESWELLQKKIFHNGGILPPYLYDIGKVIAKNCKGLPLAVVVIGGLLARTEKSLRWWSEVAESINSYLYDEGCMKILELSYNYLPENLKPCFLYLGAFPEDMLIKVKKVILLWIDEGFIQKSKTKDIEDVGKEYIHELVDRSLIIVTARSSNGEIKEFRVHDTIRDLCQMKCRAGFFFHINQGIESSTYSDPSINNHYRVSTQKESDVTTITAGSYLSNARSLLYFCKQRDKRECDLPLWKFRLAQVLDLESAWQGCDIEQLSSLVHLRHINVSLKVISRYIPSSISNLWNIRSLTLIVLKDYIHLPETFWRMTSLRHVKVSSCFLKFPDDNEHEACPKLDKVVSFSKPVLCSGRDVQRLLQRLPIVQKLGCFIEEKVHYDEESVETLDFHRKLESLKLTLTTFSSFRSRSHNYLINFPSTLKKLTLEKFPLPWTALSTIAELQHLQVLKLRWTPFPEPRLDMEDMVFQNLTFFELLNEELVEWNASVESLPSLEQLVIDCFDLEELPPCFEEIPTLKKIVDRCFPRDNSSAYRIQKEQSVLGNEVEVVVI